MTRNGGDGDSRDEQAIRTRLRDGTHVLIRTVTPDDRDELEEGFDRLSIRSRYLRFHTNIEQLTDEQLRYLTDVDQVDHVAWVALDLDDAEQRGIGVARFVRLADEPTVAEAAITVLDEYQGRGLGTELLQVLAAAAVRRGITTFRAYVLGENRAMLTVLDALGPTRTEREHNAYQIDVELPATIAQIAEEETSMAHRIFRAVTGNRLPGMHTTAPPVWMSDDDVDGTARQRLREWLERILHR